MRIFSVLSTIILLSALSFGQSGDRGAAGHCFYGCGPYVPLITTPSVSFATVSPNPVGATNATGGLIAGATNSTLSEVSGNTSAVYTVPVWYSGGGTPLIAPAVNSPMGGMHMMHPGHMERMQGEHEAGREAWIYFSSAEETASAVDASAAAKGMRHATKTYSNQDVERQNEKNGAVHYDGKTEKIQ